LLLEDRFPQIWVPSWKNRDLGNCSGTGTAGAGAHPDHESMQAVALNEGLRCKKRCVAKNADASNWNHSAWLRGPAGDDRSAGVADRLNPTIAELSLTIGQESRSARSAAADDTPRCRSAHRTGLCADHRRANAFSAASRWRAIGLVPLEDSSGNRRRLGHITKQGSSMLRFLLVEAAQVTARSLPQWRSKYLHLMMRRGRKTAKGRDGAETSRSLTMSAVSSSFRAHFSEHSEKSAHFALVDGLPFPTQARCNLSGQELKS